MNKSEPWRGTERTADDVGGLASREMTRRDAGRIVLSSLFCQDLSGLSIPHTVLQFWTLFILPLPPHPPLISSCTASSTTFNFGLNLNCDSALFIILKPCTFCSSLLVIYTHTHTRARARAFIRARTHEHTHAHINTRTCTHKE